MPEIDVDSLGVRVGLEVHQQLATGKLFCRCIPTDTDQYSAEFRRSLRASKGESGEFDQAALFEGTKAKIIVYRTSPDSSCLVEEDERPPDMIDMDAKRVALIIASALNSQIFDEMYPMRKTVVDGSNTAGFQRTILVSQGGHYNAGGTRIGIQSVCLEEDAAKILGGEGDQKVYGLDRLGIPLVEIATEPFDVKPRKIKSIALALGRILRGTQMVRRGIGSIRQDVNVSIRDGGGAVVEVKGVQQLDQLQKVVEYEAKRQYAMVQISKQLKERAFCCGPDNDENNSCRIIDITNTTQSWNSGIVKGAISKKHQIIMIAFENLAGVFGNQYAPEVRLGRDLAELVKIFGLGGIFHSDELPAYGITQQDVDGLSVLHGITAGRDAFVLLATPPEKSRAITRQILNRMREIRDNAIPRDTRLATQSGQTKFLRPRPGAARMYPETDMPVITVTQEELQEAQDSIPRSWDESILAIQDRYRLNPQLAEQMFDSRYMKIFEEIMGDGGTNPIFAASVLCSTIINLGRKDGMQAALLKDSDIRESFRLLKEDKITKESIEMIFESIMVGTSEGVDEAIKNSSIQQQVSKSELMGIIETITEEYSDLIESQKERAIGPLMGIAMKKLRGRAPGEEVSRRLSESIKERLAS